jgi:hypothetical protein
MLRGRPIDLPYDPREKAIQQLDKQEAQLKERVRRGLTTPLDLSNWTFLGPAPIPEGQTSTTRVPVSGRTISIAVHPTDPDTVYVGTAQGGLYKSTNAGANWTKLFEFNLESLAIGAITIDPTDSSIVYVGTGEPNLSADSFAGRGVYIIRNANSPAPTLHGPFRLDSSSNDIFTGRAIGRIVVSPVDNNVIFVCTTSGTVNYTATDNCGVICTLSVASNEPINGLGDGDQTPDWVVVDAHHLLLRAERSGKGSGRVYTITVTCIDGSGNTVVKTVTVQVPSNQNGK